MNNMLSLHGTVINCFLAPDFTDKKTGEVIKGRYKAQLLCESQLRNGEERKEMINLSFDKKEMFQGMQGHFVSIPVAAFPSGKTVGYYITGEEVEDLGPSVG